MVLTACAVYLALRLTVFAPVDTHGARVIHLTVHSRAVGEDLGLDVVVPAGKERRRPLLVFLHGRSGSPSSSTDDEAMFKALAKLGSRAPVIAFPSGKDSYWHNREDGNWGDYVMDEVIPLAAREGDADPRRVAIGGISMGGFGALDLGRIEPKRFCAVGGHSPAVFTSDSAAFGFDGPADFARHDLLRLARTRSPYAAPVWIDVGNRDTLRPAAAKLAHELRRDGADVTFHVWPGNHDGRYWNAHFADYLRFYADACG